MKKFFIMLTIVSIFAYSKCYASESDENEINNRNEKYGVTDFINKSQEYSDDLDLNSTYKNALKGKFDNNKFIKIILKLFDKNLKDSIKSISAVLLVVIINAILKAISENLGNKSVSKCAYYVQYILIVTILSKNISQILIDVKDSIQQLNDFTNTLIPLLTTLLIASGNVISSNTIEPILLLITNIISNFLVNVLLPVILCALALDIVSKISDNVQIDRLSKYMKKSSTWILTIIIGTFISMASLETGLTSSVDKTTKNIGKQVISTAVPVVGSVVGNAIDTISGYSNIIKNATGFVGIIVILSICFKPIINLACITITYYLGVCLAEPICDKKIVDLIESFADTFKILLAILVSITVLIIIGVSIVIKISS